MKKLHNMKAFILFVAFSFSLSSVFAQDEEKPTLMINLKYQVSNNSFQYLQLKTQLKADNKLQPQKQTPVNLYLDSISNDNLVSLVKTDEKGEAKAILPQSLKEKWSATTTHKFIAVAPATKVYDETTSELEVAKAKIIVDTANEDGTRKVTAQVLSFENGNWVPTKDVELKLGVRRLGGDLKIGDEESYTTDSLGQASGEFKLTNLPGDLKGNLTLVAKVEDNDRFGTLSIEKSVPWGVYVKHESTFGTRTLWARGGRAPIWLLFMAYTIIGLVWGTLIYLITRIYKIRKLGKLKDEEEEPVTGSVAVTFAEELVEENKS
ncbi:MAG: hypothetical protein ACM3VS_09380 [Candidatus Dadabacteria bacterium]